MSLKEVINIRELEVIIFNNQNHHQVLTNGHKLQVKRAFKGCPS